jgi:hypothetical protein
MLQVNSRRWLMRYEPNDISSKAHECRRNDRRVASRRLANFTNSYSGIKVSIQVCPAALLVIASSDGRRAGQPRQALCRPAKTDVADEGNRARRKVQKLR